MYLSGKAKETTATASLLSHVYTILQYRLATWIALAIEDKMGDACIDATKDRTTRSNESAWMENKGF